MATADIQLKGLSREQVSNLLPEGLISLCWRGSVAHGMYVPKNDPDSIDDKDIMGVYIGPLEHYLGFGRKEVYEQWEGEWDCVFEQPPSPPTVQRRETSPVPPTDSTGGYVKPTTDRGYIRGPRGGCYYKSSSGRKVYVDHSLCN